MSPQKLAIYMLPTYIFEGVFEAASTSLGASRFGHRAALSNPKPVEEFFVDAGEFANSESSAALSANTFGLFIKRPSLVTALPQG